MPRTTAGKTHGAGYGKRGRNIKVSFSENTSESLTREISVYYTPDDPDLFDWGVHMTQLPYGMTEEEYLQWLDSL